MIITIHENYASALPRNNSDHQKLLEHLIIMRKII